MTIENNAEKRSIAGKGSNAGRRKILIIRGVIAAVIVIALIIAVVKLLGGNSRSTAAYNKPDKAIEEFVDKLASGYFEGVLGIFDSKERAESINLQKYIERMQVLVPSSMPASGEYRVLNEAEFRGQAAAQTKFFAYSLQSKEEIRDSVSGNVAVSDELSAEDIVKALNPEKLKGLKMVSCDVADEVTQKSDQYKANMKDVCAIYGCKTIKEYTALFKLGDKYHQAFFTLAEYEKGWKIQSLSTTLLENDMGTGATMETTEDEYKQQLKDKE